MSVVMLRLLAWGCLLAIAIVTLGAIELRPATAMGGHVERFGAFALVGALFAAAYPRHLLLVAVLVLGTAVALEAMQLLAPGRGARLGDGLTKLAGAAAGVGIGAVAAKIGHGWKGSGA